jgi:hypothetical protein
MRRTISSASVLQRMLCESARLYQRLCALKRLYSRTIRGKYIETTQFGTSTMELMRRSAQTLHSM